MRTQTSALKPRDGLLTLSGYGIRIAVERRHLVVADGVGRERRTGALHRATARLKRLVVIGHSGFISLEAIRWLNDVGASYVQIDSDGGLIASYAPRAVNDVALRRAQAIATSTGAGLEIAKALITDKLEAQRKALQRTGDNGLAIGLIADAEGGIAGSANEDELRWCEATAATAYWNAIAATPMRFVRSELRRVPAHWLTFGSRHSALTNNTRKAITPANAMLNYLYAILESETRIALLARGLDPELGIFHSLQRFRNSLAHDVMEPVRPEVDSFVLDLVETRVFSAADFMETREGSCRLAPELARILANTAPRWGVRLRPVVARVATGLLREPTPARPLDGSRRPRFAGTLHRRVAGGSVPAAPTSPPPRCEECGGALSRGRYAKCGVCERVRQARRAPRLGGIEELARLRASGTDPAHGGRAGLKRSTIASRRHAEAMASTGRERLTAEERERFTREVLPQLTDVSVAALARATSLSKTYSSFIKRGLRTPHPRHWEALIRAAAIGRH